MGEVISTILKTRKGGRDRQEVKELNINQTVTVNRTRCKYKTRQYLYKETQMSLLEKYQEPKPEINLKYTNAQPYQQGLFFYSGAEQSRNKAQHWLVMRILAGRVHIVIAPSRVCCPA